MYTSMTETMIYLGQTGSTKPEFHWVLRWTWGKQQNYKDGRLEEDNVKSSLPWVRPSPAVSCFLLLGLDSHPAMQRHNKHTLLWQLGTILCCVAIEDTAWNRHFFRCMPIFVQFEILKFFEITSNNFSTKRKNFTNAHCLFYCHLQTHSTMTAIESQNDQLIGDAINWGEREVH